MGNTSLNLKPGETCTEREKDEKKKEQVAHTPGCHRTARAGAGDGL